MSDGRWHPITCIQYLLHFGPRGIHFVHWLRRLVTLRVFTSYRMASSSRSPGYLDICSKYGRSRQRVPAAPKRPVPDPKTQRKQHSHQSALHGRHQVGLAFIKGQATPTPKACCNIICLIYLFRFVLATFGPSKGTIVVPSAPLLMSQEFAKLGRAAIWTWRRP